MPARALSPVGERFDRRSDRRPTRPVARRGASVLVATAAATLLVTGPAAAHVTVGADDSRRGAADSVLTFRVPTEDDSASTVKVAISFPRATPLASVKPAPKPGWTLATLSTRFATPITTDDGTLTEGVSQVVYTATTSGGIPAGRFDTFQVLVGPLPRTGTTLSFPTVQTYSNGRSTAWIQPVTDPAVEPDAPAPTLRLLAADGATAPPAGSPGVTVTAGVTGTVSGTGDSTRTLAVIALVVAAGGLLAGLGGVVTGRRSR